MPTALPLPVLPGGPLNPVDWLDLGDGLSGAQQSALMRGAGEALAPWQRRQIRGAPIVAQGLPVWLQSRPYDRGASAYAPKFGTLFSNPIGAGVLASYRLPTIAGPGARYQMGAIWFDVQTVPTSIVMSPTMRAESLNALIGQSHVAAMYPTNGMMPRSRIIPGKGPVPGQSDRTAYKGYSIIWNRQSWVISRDGHHIGYANTLDQAKAIVDQLT